MVAEGHSVASLTGGIEGQKRDAIIDAFRSGSAKVLITTNVLARGIDVRTVSMVVNYVSFLERNPPYSSVLFKTSLTTASTRIFPNSINPEAGSVRQTARPTSTVSAVRVVSDASESPYPLSPTKKSGRCFRIFRTISRPTSRV